MTAIAWKAPVWEAPTSEDTEDVDEPPDRQHSPERFRRTTIRRQSEQTSLLTKAIMGTPETDGHEDRSTFYDYRRRRSMASNISVASTADLTSDTGFTSPARTNTPSPPLPEMPLSQINGATSHPKNFGFLDRPIQLRAKSENTVQPSKQPANAPPKRCIQFACAANPPKQQPAAAPQPVQSAAQTQEAPRRPCIKFACPSRPATTQNTPPRSAARASRADRSKSPATPKARQAATSPSTPRQNSSRKQVDERVARPKYLRADSIDLTNDGSQFHEFASENTREADWIRRDSVVEKSKLTINDTLTKENHIRRLATEAEEEAELEEHEGSVNTDSDEDNEEDNVDDEDEDNFDEDGEDEEDEEDDEDEDDEDCGLSEGYYTDEETGFASSDESDAEEDGNMVLWTLSKSPAVRPQPTVPLIRTQSFHGHQGHQSDSSTTTTSNHRRSNMQRVKPSEVTDLPDSTDFVCGTLDEDRPLEELYITSLAARRKDKLRVIPQDIDPSFPASDPEDEDGEDFYNPVRHDSDDDLPGEMEDLHHEQDRSRGRRKSGHASPRKYHSPPPKRHPSPLPPHRARGKSPRNLFDRRSPRRMRSPAPKGIMTTPLGSLKQGNHVEFHLAARPGPTTTKSLPKAGLMFHKHRRPQKGDDDDIHVRGAVDIVKGLEKKRQRRKEKFYQKYCNRARRGQIPERKPQPGLGAERMKELGLLMAGKKDQGNYVLSV